MPVYVQMWFHCGALDCEERDELMVEVLSPHSRIVDTVGIFAIDSSMSMVRTIPDGWAYRVISTSPVLVCPIHRSLVDD